jgi:hypothetical protein
MERRMNATTVFTGIVACPSDRGQERRNRLFKEPPGFERWRYEREEALLQALVVCERVRGSWIEGLRYSEYCRDPEAPRLRAQFLRELENSKRELHAYQSLFDYWFSLSEEGKIAWFSRETGAAGE